MSCKEVFSRKYQTRKSPAFHAGDCKGMKKEGKDGTYVSQANKRGIYTWVKVGKTLKRKGKFYDIEDNGNVPFRVYVDGSNVNIYKATYIGHQDPPAYDKLVRTVKTKKVHLGGKKSQLGNSIVLHLSGNKYMYIGHEIYEFQMEDEVDSYFSLIGNSDVPYPVLLGTKYVYFMLDRCYVPRSEFDPKMTKADWEDAYQRYYGFTDPMTGKKPAESKNGLKKKCKKMKGFYIVVKRE